jgi:hypothetical protein
LLMEGGVKQATRLCDGVSLVPGKVLVCSLVSVFDST